MRNTVWVAGLALVFGCAMGGQETKKSEARTAQDQAQQSLQQASDAQKKATDEQAKAEQFQQEVTQKQKELADAQAKLRGQRVKAEQAQRDAGAARKEAQQEAQQQQQQMMQTQKSQTQKSQAQEMRSQQSWTPEQNAQGTVVQAQSDQLQIRTWDQELLKLQVTDSTAVTLNGQTSSVSQLQLGSDVRASYQMVDGKAKALTIDAT
jgi:colicin import membrane protein